MVFLNLSGGLACAIIYSCMCFIDTLQGYEVFLCMVYQTLDTLVKIWLVKKLLRRWEEWMKPASLTRSR